MSLEIIQQYHQKYLLLSDQFKCLWTLNQVLQAVYKHYLNKEIPYKIDFRSLYNQIRGLPQMFSGYAPGQVDAYITGLEKSNWEAFESLHGADKDVSPSELRRFFESYKDEEEDKVILQIIKFYIHRQAIDEDIRDKLDFLITRVGGIHSEGEGRYILRDREFLKELFQKLMAIGKLPPVDPDLKDEYLTLFQEMRSEVVECKTLEDFVLSGVLKAIRALKAKVGIAFLHPDILVKIAELNITTKNRYVEIYKKEEASLLEETTKVKNLRLKGEAGTPELKKEFKRVDELEALYEKAKERGDLKLEIMSEFKKATRSILNQLETDFTFNPEEQEAVPPPPAPGMSDAADDDMVLQELLQSARVKMEEFEREALTSYQMFKKLDVVKDADRLILRGLAHRARIEEIIEPLIAAEKATEDPDGALVQKARGLVKAGEDLDKDFQYLIEDQLFMGNEKPAQMLLRGRYRLMRSLSGLWLLMDRIAPQVPSSPPPVQS
jgi:hypothetical protein